MYGREERKVSRLEQGKKFVRRGRESETDYIARVRCNGETDRQKKVRKEICMSSSNRLVLSTDMHTHKLQWS